MKQTFNSIPPLSTLVVLTSDGLRELILHPSMEIKSEADSTYIVHGDKVVPIPRKYKPYTTYGKVWNGEDGRFYRLSKVKGIDDHPDDISRITQLVTTKCSTFLELGFLEISKS